MALDYKIIGQRLKKARQNKHLTQEELSEKIDVSVAFLSRIECGSSFISLKRLDEICDILGVSKGSILDGASTNTKDYLNKDFAELLSKCSKDKYRLIYKLAETIAYEDY